ncbi:MAG: class I SAM-dependent methyltransferase [Blastocatellia bacterium]|nr:class I SAM-dependent methyltransferase [Blastocatellia bacterium]
MARQAEKRFEWAVSILAPQPSDRILEIGCGRGGMTDAVASQLESGEIIAIDRSPKMIDAATERNAAYISAGTATLILEDFADSALTEHTFDKIFVFNLNVFWMDPRDELSKVASLLSDGGRFYIFHIPPPGGDTAEYDTAFRTSLEKSGFEVLQPTFDGELNAVCLIATPR